MSARKTERLLNLVICLLATRRYLSAEQIRQTVAGYEELGDDAFKRKFERDKEDLRDLGIPLETGSDSVFDDEPGYRIRRDDYSLPDIAFEPAELAVLGVAARTWQQASLSGQAFEAVAETACGRHRHRRRGSGRDRDAGVDQRTRLRAVATGRHRSASGRVRLPRGRRSPPCRTVGPGVVARPLVPRRTRHRPRRAARVPDRPHRRARCSSSVRPAVCRCPRAPTSAPSCVAWTPTATVSPRRCASVRAPRSGCGGAPLSVVPLDAGWDVVELLFPDIERLADEVVAYGGEVVVVEPAQARDAIVARLRAVLQ